MISLQLGEACFRRLAHGSGCEPWVAVVAAVHRGQRPAQNTCIDGRLNSSMDSDDTRKPLFSNYTCPRAPITHSPTCTYTHTEPEH